MCKFCEALKTGNKILWCQRSSMADDNFCEHVNGSNCDYCKDCISEFSLQGYQYDNDVYVSVAYHGECTDLDDINVVVYKFSEGIQFNFCPYCGDQISEHVREFTEIYCKISIEED